jgi:hypothetical protein
LVKNNYSEEMGLYSISIKARSIVKDSWGTQLDRGEAIALLREIAANQVATPNWVSLVNGKADSYELQIKPESVDLACLKLIVEKHNLAWKEANGLFIIS